MKSLALKLTVALPARPEQVFEAMTDSKIIARWSGQKAKVEPRVGGKIDLFDGWVKGRVLEFKAGKSLVCTWLPGDWPDGAKESVVKYRFASTRAGTKVSLEHSGFPDEMEKNSHRNGWMEFVFNPLKDYLSQR